MAGVPDRIDSLRTEIHGVDNRVVRVETELREHRAQSTLQHDATMAALAELRRDLSDQGRTPPSTDRALPTTPPPSLPPTPVSESSEPGTIKISPARTLKLITAWWHVWLALGLGAGGGLGIRGCVGPEPSPAAQAVHALDDPEPTP